MASALALGTSSFGGAVATGSGFGTAVGGALVGCGTAVARPSGRRDGGRLLGACGLTILTDTTGSWTGREAALRPTR